MVADLQFLVDLSYAALGLLVAVLVIYVIFRLLGKFAKFLVTAAVVVLVLWLLFSNRSILQYVVDFMGQIKEQMGFGALSALIPFK